MRDARALLGILALAFSLSSSAAGHDEAVKSATAAATSWLAEVDAAQYDRSWDDAAPVFQTAVSKPVWAEKLGAVREPLGVVRKREVLDAQWTGTVPGAPDGDYVVLRFHTVFANKQDAIETITPMKTSDGGWHVSGYFVR